MCMSQELLQITVNKASMLSKMPISNFQIDVCENCSKLAINSLPNLKASMKYYVLTHYISGSTIQDSNDYTSSMEQILQYLPS